MSKSVQRIVSNKVSGGDTILEERQMSKKRSSLLGLAGAAVVLAVGSVQGATVTLLSSDPSGSTSFNTGPRWSDLTAPGSGNDYVNNTNGRTLRTPPDASNYTFAGDSLSLSAGGLLLFKNTDNAAVITINNLILTNGTLSQDTNNVAGLTTATLDGAITLVGVNGGLIRTQSGNGIARILNIDSTISGDGALRQGLNTNINTSTSTLTTFLNSANSYSGGTTLLDVTTTKAGALLVAATDSALGTGNVTVGYGGTLTLQDGALNNYIHDSALVTLNPDTLVDTTTRIAKINLNFSGTDVVGGLTINGVAQAAGTYGATGSGATNIDDAHFLGTGVLSVVVPEPGVGMLAVAIGSVLGLRRRRNA
jgi:hypothetical protein